MCVCVCVCERERERDSLGGEVCVCARGLACVSMYVSVYVSKTREVCVSLCVCVCVCEREREREG